MRVSDVLSLTSGEPHDEQDSLLQGVSRTFALTIPQLPSGLQTVVTNAYLLCRIADTIEDESALSSDRKEYFHAFFQRVVSDTSGADDFADELTPLLVTDALDAEVELVRNTSRVIAVTRGLAPAQQQALQRCLDIMCHGMPQYERHASRHGLPDEAALADYCYHVAGVVGETLTTLFCEYAADIAAQREPMQKLGVAFGQGLQMVNILKDFWADRARGVCWLPADLFAREGGSPADVDPVAPGDAFARVYARLIGVAHAHLRSGLEYTLLVPPAHPGVRRFCLLALALAVQTLQCLHDKPQFTDGNQVKVSRRALADTLLKTRRLATRDDRLRAWFERMGRDLPLEESVGVDTVAGTAVPFRNTGRF